MNWRGVAKCVSVCCLVILCCAVRIAAQDAQPDTYAGFEGQKVAKVEISIKPTMDAEAFRARIKQKADEPFSMQAIRESVAALRETRLFSKIQLSIEPDVSGSNVLFILQPASYVGMVDFPGATKAFAYTRLLQAVNIPEQSPYVDELPSQGTTALLKFFRDNGYFDAAVNAVVERDDPRRIVDIHFDCQLKRLARVRQVNFQGISQEESDRLRKTLDSFWAKFKGASLKPGSKYSRERIQKSVDYIRGHLRGEGRLAPLVRFTSPTYYAESGQADLNFEVDAGPMLAVRMTGAKVSKRTMKKLVPIYEENSVDQDLMEEGRRNLLWYFQSKGYFDAHVNAHLDRGQDSVSVVYDVDRGSKHRVEEVKFRDNHFFSDKQLQAFVAVRKGHALFGHVISHGKYSEDMIRKSVDAVTAAYKNAGFADVVVTSNVAETGPRVGITFKIAEGEQNKVNTFTLKTSGNETRTVAAVMGKHPLHLAPGKPYSPALQQEDRDDILARYLDEGYLNAQIEPTATFTGANRHLVDVVFTINEGSRGKISQVAILGDQTTRPKLITKVTSPQVTAGEPLSLGNFLTAESDLYDLGVFDWVSVKPLAPLSDQQNEEVLIKVHESARNSVDFGFGLEVIPRSGNVPVGTVALPGIPPLGLGSKFTSSQNSYWGPRFSFQYARHNLRGRAETASFGIIYSRLDQRATLTYADPHLWGTSWSALSSVSMERSTQNSIYIAEVAQASSQLEKSLNKKKTSNLFFRYSFQHTLLSDITIPDLVLPEDQRVRLSTLSVQYVRDTRDKPLDAHHGVFQTATLSVTPKAFGSSANFVRFFGQTSFYKPIKPWLIWANNFRLGIAAPFGETPVPLSERFFSGGADSLRGFPIDGAGPQRPVSVCSNPSVPSTCTLISVPVGGDMLAIVNTELRFPMPIVDKLGGAFFYDGGNVYSSISARQFADNFTHAIGFGIRYQTPVGPVRIDIGERLTSVPGVQATQYFVTLGQSF